MGVSLVLTWKCCILENIDQHVLIDWHYQSIFTLRDLSLQSDFVFDIDIFPIKLKGNGLKPTYFTFLAASLILFSNCLYLWLVCWLCERWFYCLAAGGTKRDMFGSYIAGLIPIYFCICPNLAKALISTDSYCDIFVHIVFLFGLNNIFYSITYSYIPLPSPILLYVSSTVNNWQM